MDMSQKYYVTKHVHQIVFIARWFKEVTIVRRLRGRECDKCGDIPLYTLVCDMYLPVYPPQPAYFTVLHLVVTRLLY
jgi:hypothetical protein